MLHSFQTTAFKLHRSPSLQSCHSMPTSAAAAASPAISTLAQLAAAQVLETPSVDATAAAVARGNVQQLKPLLSTGCEIKTAAAAAAAGRLRSLLSVAVAHSQVAAAAVLLQHGAPLRAFMSAQELCRAAQLACEPMIQLLLEAGADIAMAISIQASHVAWLRHVARLSGDARGVGLAASAQAATAAAGAVPGIQSSKGDSSAAAATAAAVAALGRLLTALGDINKPTAAHISLSGCPDLPPCKAWTTLQVAAAMSWPGAVQVLLQHGAAVDAAVEGLSAVGWAAMRNADADVKLLLAAGAVPTALDVLTVAKGGSESMLQRLLAGGGDATAASSYTGDTALHYAINRGFSLDTVQQLLAAGCHADWAHRDRVTALHIAASKGLADIVKALLAAGADTDIPDENGYRPLDLTVLLRLAECRGPQHASYLNVVRVLLAAGADTGRGDNKDAPLSHAAVHGDLELVRLLLTAGAAVDDTRAGQSNLTALHHAAGEGHADVVEALLAAGANLEARARGWTPLGLAVCKLPEDHNSLSSEQQAAWQRYKEAARVLVAHEADVNANASQEGERTLLHTFAMDGNVPAMQLLLELGADVNKAAWDGYRPLDTVVMSAPLTTRLKRAKLHAIAKLLLDAGASMQATSTNMAPLIHAANLGDLVLVRMLIAAGASVNMTNALSSGLTYKGLPLMSALDFAAQTGRIEMVQELLSCGALIHNHLGDSCALNCAAWCGHTTVVQLLLGNTHDPVTVADALAALTVALQRINRPHPHYEISALMQLYIIRRLQAQRRAADAGADFGGANLFAGIAGVIEAPVLVGRVDRGALSMALLRGWCGDAAGVAEGQDAVAARGRDSAAVRADAREALVQLARAARTGR